MSRARLMLCLVLLVPVGAAAQTIDQESARNLQQTLQSWFAGLLGPNLGAAEQRLRITAQDDHFHATLPFADATGDNEISADVRPLDGGRWSIDALHLPAASHFNLQMPEPGGPPGAKVPTSLALSIGTQNSHAMLDPAFASASRLDIDLGNLGVVTDSARQHQEQHIDRYEAQTTLQPSDGRMDLISDATLTGWRTAARQDDKPAVAFGADRIQSHGRIDGIDRDRAPALLTAVGGLLATLPPSLPSAAAASGGTVPLSAPARAALRAFIEALRGIVSGMQGDETVDGLQVAIAGQGEAKIRHLRFGADAAAPGGMLHAGLDIALEGIAVQDLPPQVQSLMPHHVELHPTIAGVSLADLTTLALDATDQDADRLQLQAEAAALLAHGGVTVGLDTLALDLGPADLHGRGRVLVTAPDKYQAEAHVTATGLDELMQQARGDPAFRQALPFLAIARGFARPEGDHLVWDIVAGDSGLSVNGVELANPHAEGGQPDKR